MINKLLIANRGEIACRIMKTCKKLGVRTVAVYSDIDKDSKHVEMADQAFRIGKNAPMESYLRSEKILEVALQNNCQAIHPGFGFLSENADFAEACESHKLIFVGPPSSAIKAMGSKSESKKIMENAKVPVVPGYHGDDQDKELLLQEARKIGYPIMIKAVMGGGGKGMRIVRREEDFFSNLEMAKNESLKSFKDDRVLIEKFIEKPRHIEIQIFGDKHKNYVYLFERDCSIQRRHQKVVEEAPSNIGSQLRESIGLSAVNAGRAVGYYNAGTVEFIFDTLTNKYYFMEMNTRLQVEHPITEMITKQDLVQWQLLVASGMELPLKQNELKIDGHSIEARVYAENPYNPSKEFLPATGKLNFYSEPKEQEGVVRVESGVREKDEISIHYDAMISKLVVWGQNRELAIAKMLESLHNYKIIGLPTNIKFLKNVCNNKDFKDWNYDTNFIAQHKEEVLDRKDRISEKDILSAVLAKLQAERDKNAGEVSGLFENFRVNHPLRRVFNLVLHAQNLLEPKKVRVSVEFIENSKYDIEIFDSHDKLLKKFKSVSLNNSRRNTLAINLEESILKREFYLEKHDVYILDENNEALHVEFANEHLPATEEEHGSKNKLIKSPMPGIITKVLVKEGETVKKGQQFLALEAMKMENAIYAVRDCKVKAVLFSPGAKVEAGQTLIELE